MGADNIVSRFFGLITSPGRTMETVRENPKWLVAGLILFVAMAVFTALTLHIAGPEQMELMRDTRFGQMMPEEDWQQSYEESFEPPLTKRILNGLGGGFATWVIVFIYGLVYLLFAKLAGGPGTFKQNMGATYWSMLVPYLLGSYLKLPLIYAKQSVMEVSIGLAALAPSAEITSAKYQALLYFGDFFQWWGLALLIIGFMKVHGFSGGKAATVVILPWLLITGAIMGLGLLFL